MSFDEYIASRAVFLLKADHPVINPRHEVIAGERTMVYRYSRLMLHDYGLPFEAQIVDRVLEEGLGHAIPMLVDLDEVGTHSIQRRARGMEVAKVPVAERLTIWSQLAQWLRQLHGIAGEGAGLIVDTERLSGAFETWRDYFKAQLVQHIVTVEDVGLIDAATGTELALLLMRCPEQAPTVLLHGDLNDRNVFAQDGRFTDLIDWEDAMVGDPVFELASWACFTDHYEHRDWFIDAYYGTDPRPADLWLRFWSAYTRIALARMVHLLRYGHTDLAAAQQRIQQGLTHLKTA